MKKFLVRFALYGDGSRQCLSHSVGPFTCINKAQDALINLCKSANLWDAVITEYEDDDQEGE
jgi:hypothetical protein